MLRSFIAKQMQKEHVPDTLIDLTANRIHADLPKFELGDDANFIKRLNDAIATLNLEDQLNAYSLLDIDPDTYQIKGYKTNALDLIKDTLAIHLHDNGTVPNTDIALLRARLALESGNREIEEKTPIEYAKSRGVVEELLLYAINNSLEVDGVDPIAYAHDKGEQLEGKDPIIWALDNGKQIDGKDPLEWAVENDGKINGHPTLKVLLDNVQNDLDKIAWMKHAMDSNAKVDGEHVLQWVYRDANLQNQEVMAEVFKYALDKDLMIDGIPFAQWFDETHEVDYSINEAVNAGKTIAGKPALKWAIENDKQVSGKPALEWAYDSKKITKKSVKHAIDNDFRVGGKSALEWSVRKGIIPKDKALSYVIENDLQVEGKPGAQWVIEQGADPNEVIKMAEAKGAKIAGQEPMQWVRDNSVALGEHTAKVYAKHGAAVEK